MSDLNPCPNKCGGDIDLDFRIHELWKSCRWTVGVAYCSYCGECAPFRSYAMDIQEFTEDAHGAWNQLETHD